jgi:hypothetical protein
MENSFSAIWLRTTMTADSSCTFAPVYLLTNYYLLLLVLTTYLVVSALANWHP